MSKINLQTPITRNRNTPTYPTIATVPDNRNNPNIPNNPSNLKNRYGSRVLLALRKCADAYVENFEMQAVEFGFAQQVLQKVYDLRGFSCEGEGFEQVQEARWLCVCVRVLSVCLVLSVCVLSVYVCAQYLCVLSV